MEVDGGSMLHPFMATARPNKGDDSVDMGADTVKPLGEDEETRRVFGMPTVVTQGPTGSRVPDLDDRSRSHQREESDEEEELAGLYGYPEDGDAPPDSAGPHPPVEAEMTAEEFTSDPGAQAAADAVLAARRSGRSGSAAMLDALEAAEGTYERQHEARKLQAQAHGLQGPAPQAAASHGQAGGAVAVQVPPGAPQAAGPGQWGAAGNERAPDTPRKAAICEGTREKMVQAVFEALQANPRYSAEPTRNLMHYAQTVEDALFVSSHSKQVYLSKVSNAVRLARSAPDVTDIPRIASGEPREVAEGHTAGEPTPYMSGLTGYVIKPQM